MVTVVHFLSYKLGFVVKTRQSIFVVTFGQIHGVPSRRTWLSDIDEPIIRQAQGGSLKEIMGVQLWDRCMG